MIKDHLAILFSCYLMSNLFLIPIFALNFSGLLGLVANAWQIRIHKYTVILVLLCPILIYLYSVPLQTLGVTDDDVRILQEKNETNHRNDHIGELDNRSGASLPSSPALLPGPAKSILLDAIYFIIEYIKNVQAQSIFA